MCSGEPRISAGRRGVCKKPEPCNIQSAISHVHEQFINIRLYVILSGAKDLLVRPVARADSSLRSEGPTGFAQDDKNTQWPTTTHERCFSSIGAPAGASRCAPMPR